MRRLFCAFCLAAVGCIQLACGDSPAVETPPPATTAAPPAAPPVAREPWQFAVLALEMDEKVQISPQAAYEATEGNQFAVVRVGITPAAGNSERQLSVKGIAVTDTADASFPCATSEFVHDLDKDGDARIVACEVPVGTQLKTLKLGTQALDLSKVTASH